MIVPVARVPRKELFVEAKGSLQEPKLREQIAAARQKQTERQNMPNSRLTNKQLGRHAKLSPQTQNILDAATERLNLSARASFKIIRVARTIADLNDHTEIAPDDIAEALQYRQ
jgi:magnesium chelatase family protein